MTNENIPEFLNNTSEEEIATNLPDVAAVDTDPQIEELSEDSIEAAIFGSDDENSAETEDIDLSVESIQEEPISENKNISDAERLQELDMQLSELELIGKSENRGGPKARPRTTARRRTHNMIHNVDRSYVDPEEIRKKTEIVEIYQSFYKKRILTGRIVGVRPIYDNRNNDNGKMRFIVTVKRGSTLIYIPFEKFTSVSMSQLVTAARERHPERSEYAIIMGYLRSRLNAEVDFIVTNLPESVPSTDELMIVGGSRVQAMRRQRIFQWYQTDGENYNILVGDKAQARIVTVARNGIRVELFGVETMISSRDLSWSMIQDATAFYDTGKNVIIKITDITRNEEDDYAVSFTASVKEAKDDRREEGLQTYIENGLYAGQISYIRVPSERNPDAKPAIFVTLEEGIQCLCPFPLGAIPPRIGRKCTVRITNRSERTKNLYGLITHVFPKDQTV